MQFISCAHREIIAIQRDVPHLFSGRDIRSITQAALLRIPKAEKALKLIHLQRSLRCFSEIIILLERGSSASVSLEELQSRETVIDALLMPDASLTLHHLVHSGDSRTFHVALHASIDARSVFSLQNVTVGTRVQHEADVHCVGKGAACEIVWAFHGKHNDSISVSAHVDAEKQDQKAKILLRGIAENSAHVACDGFMKIGKAAAGTEADLSEQILLLDPSARARAIPRMSVATNDVQAHHSAAISRIQPEDLFYVQSRGLDSKEARTVFIDGFLGEVLRGMPNGSGGG